MDGDSPHDPMRLTEGDPLAGLSAWVADGRVDAAAEERSRRRWLARQADEEASIAGILLDLAERGEPVTLRTSAGRNARGVIAALGADFVVVREEHLGDVWIPAAAIATVRSAPGEEPPKGDRPLDFPVTLAEALVEIAAEHPLVLVGVAGDEIRGELRRAGTDVIAVATASNRRVTVHVSVDALDHIVLLGR